jgi:hypothetical protein
MKHSLSSSALFCDGLRVSHRIPVCPATQIPKGSFENGALLRRRDNFSEYLCSDASRFQVAREELMSWECIGFIGLYRL